MEKKIRKKTLLFFVGYACWCMCSEEIILPSHKLQLNHFELGHLDTQTLIEEPSDVQEIPYKKFEIDSDLFKEISIYRYRLDTLDTEKLFLEKNKPGFIPTVDEKGNVYKKIVLNTGSGKNKSGKKSNDMGLSYYVNPDVNLKTGPVFIKDPHQVGETKWGLQFSLNIPITTEGH